jgi:hypothetical protein
MRSVNELCAGPLAGWETHDDSTVDVFIGTKGDCRSPTAGRPDKRSSVLLSGTPHIPVRRILGGASTADASQGHITPPGTA